LFKLAVKPVPGRDSLEIEGPRDPAFGTPLRKVDLAIAAVAVAGSCGAVVVIATGGAAANPTAFAAVLIANVVTLAIGGLLWRHGRPSSSFGYLLFAEAALILVSALAGSSAPVAYLIGLLGAWAAALGATWLLLVFPGTRPRGAGWIVMWIALASFLVGTVPRLLASTTMPSLPVVGRCTTACPANPAHVADAAGVAEAFRHVESSLVSLWGLGLFLFLAAQLLGASYPRRRLLAPVFAASAPFVLVLTVNAVASDLLGLRAGDAAVAIFAGTRIVLPLGFIAALLFARVYAGETLGLMAARLMGRPSIGAVEQLVRRVLDDPRARLAFWLPRGALFVDRHGTKVVLDEAAKGKSWRVFGEGNTCVLAIVHDEVLADDPELLDAVGATTLLALENRRLEQDLLDSFDVLHASQRRLVAAASSERRRIERDLHDGVQQKLVALRIHLELALEAAGGESDLGQRLAHLGVEFDEALDDLRTVAHGIYPPLLSDGGLAPALQEAAHRSTVPLALEIDDDVGRLSEDCEVAIYYSCLEALQNVAKHAGEGAAASLRLWRDPRAVRFSVSDDGAGFVLNGGGRGAGLTNMSDRLGAVGGTLVVRSAPGEGTTVEGRVETESSNGAGRDVRHL
jgi:signal transduction histidine kinase